MMIEPEMVFHGMKIVSCCGGGAFGEVYCCEELSGRKVALKVLRKDRIGPNWERELQGVRNYSRITDEAPELLKIFHVEEDETCFWYTMEPADSSSSEKYVPDTLAARLQKGPLPPEQLFEVLSGVFRGVQLIHKAGFAHRDIKPDNVIFVKGIPKLADIGLFSSLSTTMTRLAGSLEFIPPEARSADALDSSDRAGRQRNDLYAFGKVIYCAVTGSEPQHFPSVPPEWTPAPPAKLFLRLAFQLCERKKQFRLDSIKELQRRFESIRKKLAEGETIADSIAYQVWLRRCRFPVSIFRFGWRSLLNILFIICFVLIFSRMYSSPELLFDLKKIPTQKHVNKTVGITIPFPAQWKVMSAAEVKKKCEQLKAEKKLDGFSLRKISILEKIVDRGKSNEYVFPDFEKKPLNYIAVCPLIFAERSLSKVTDRALRRDLKKLFLPQYGTALKIGEIKREEIGPWFCVNGDMSIDFVRIGDSCPCFFFLFQTPKGFFAFMMGHDSVVEIEFNEYLYQCIEKMRKL